MALSVTDDTFGEEVLDFKGVVLVDLWAEWCGPCKAIAPIIEELASEYSTNDSVKLVKLDVDENPETQSKYRVMSIPTLLIFNQGELANTIVGLRSKDSIKESIEEQLD